MNQSSHRCVILLRETTVNMMSLCEDNILLLIKDAMLYLMKGSHYNNIIEYFMNDSVFE